MSEFKFACPICGQHITADSKDTGSQISCPTCYRKIVVPQAPTSAETKFVLSASEANKPRPASATPTPLEGIPRAPAKTVIPPVLIVLLVLACASGATLFLLRHKIFHAKPPPEEAQVETVSSKIEPAQPEYAGTNRWTLDLADATFPDLPVSGSVHRRAFELDRATLTGSNLTLRVGSKGSVELGVNIFFFNRQAEELSGKTAEVKPSDPKAPRVVLHWMEAERKSQTFRSGYAMKVEFGPVTNDDIPGKIFLCLPDGGQSWVAGTFHAEIRKPSPPKPRAPAPTGPKTE
jgi:DNA-directed RNA polymerase subunit RPC12/RpoP